MYEGFAREEGLRSSLRRRASAQLTVLCEVAPQRRRMKGLDDLAVAKHLQHLFRIEDVHMDVLGFLLMLLAYFLYAGGKESVGEIVMIGRIGRKGHEEPPFAALISGFFG